ncbi:hypothetical protein [Pseudomonas cremoricolorata]|uniref:Lipoprotein n=1 Tax=Pseudomonas cremoricolorata TaxID=157783 RepID=A0A089YGS5_9PSED|nr:hypothetical protein [Pseudomonas cremoricolorata]AIR90918.1 hypothetical protein LK03_17335 [Pseudomonas cremoricolorata]
MLRTPRFVLPLLLAGALAACGGNDRDKQIDTQFPLQKHYQTTIDSIVPPFAAAHPKVSEDKIQSVVREHFTFEEYRTDMHKLYGKEHFNDAEFEQIAGYMKDPAKAQQLGQTPDTKALGEKLNGYMMETARDENLRKQATERVQAINEELDKIEKK